MEIIQIPLAKMATFCYVVADKITKTCALIDPAFEIEKILQTVKENDLKVTYVINTHCHSDHSAGNAAIIEATGAKLLIHKKDARFLNRFPNKIFTRLLGGKTSPLPDTLLNDGDRIDIGETRLEVIHTPGHTPGGISLYCSGHVITGDTLFVGSIGRTDLPGGSLKQLVLSVKEKLYTLPGDTIVWPGHHYGSKTSSTIEIEKQTNPFIK